MAETTIIEEGRFLASSRVEGPNHGEPDRTAMAQGGDSSHFSFQLTLHKLNGKNYLEWAQSLKLAIDGRGKLSHLNGEVKKPGDGDPKLKAWRLENSLVTT